MKYLGIDAGEKKIGLSVSDDDGILAFPLKVLMNDDFLKENLTLIVQERKIDGIVIGHSSDLNMKENEKVMFVARKIEKIFLEKKYKVYFEPEWFTTQEARRIKDDKKI